MPKAKPAKSVSKAKGKTNAAPSIAEKILEQTANDPAGKVVLPEGFTGLTIQGVEVVFTQGTPATANFQAQPQEAEPKQVEGELLDAENEGSRQASPTPLAAAEDRQNDAGDDRDSVAGTVDNPATILPSTRAERLPGESRAACWERLRKMARSAGMPRGQGPGSAYLWADEQTNRLFPPDSSKRLEDSEEPPSIAVAPAPAADDGVSGLSNLPPSWPELPANAQLQVEIAWVTANRLRVRCGTGVDLSKALSPAPSYSALSWLETSILFPAKFADISVKATADNDSEKEFVRRERLAIEEIRSILKEMQEPGG